MTHGRDHLGLVLPVVVACLVAERLYAVGGWDITTALAILREAGVANVLLGSTVAFIAATAYWLVGYLVAVAAYRMSRGMGFGWLPAESGIFVVVLGLGLIVLLTPSLFLIIYAVLLVLVVHVDYRGRSSGSTYQWSPYFLINGLIQVVVIVFLISTTPWMPRELLTVDGRRTAAVGYVLNSEDPQAVLLHRPREVTFIPRASITVRQICGTRSNSWIWKPLPVLTGWGPFSRLHAGQATYPACPE